jgi:glutamate carboxypeptidase
VTTIEHFRQRLPHFLTELEELVAIETPTGDIDGANRAAAWLEERLAPFGELDSVPLAGHGRLVHLRRDGSGQRVMLVGHSDTVWPVGSWPELWRESDGRIFGPGVYDMKGGLLFIIELLRWLDATGAAHPTLEILINPDEEIGSVASRELILDAARRNDVVLVLEPSTSDGVIKLARKGSGEYVLTIFGRSAHQGVEPESGVNAVVEAAHQVLRLLALEDLGAGTTVGPNVIQSGSVSNVVPDRAELRIDVRAWTADEQHRLDEGIAALRPVLEGSRLELAGGWNRPPMEMSPASLAIFERARAIGESLGLDLKWVRWGGSSDANLTAAVGTPTVDGLGPVGEGSHQRTECIEIDPLPARMALFAELVASLATPVGNAK